MNRIIKFRVYDNISKIMHHWSKVEQLSIKSFTNLDHYIPSQYIGINDKNAKGIYVGDNIIHKHSTSNTDTLTVIWDQKNLKYTLNAIKVDDYWYDTDKLEVIGNIYETK